MRSPILLTVAAILIASVYSEKCTQASDCNHTMCDNLSEAHCIDNTCTCTIPSNYKCTTQQDCMILNAWDCASFRRHCIDKVCRCIRYD